jgi:hypothetical protein
MTDPIVDPDRFPPVTLCATTAFTNKFAAGTDKTAYAEGEDVVISDAKCVELLAGIGFVRKPYAAPK